METAKLYISIALFDLYQDIFLVTKDSVNLYSKVTMEDIPELVYSALSKDDFSIDEIELHGNPEYCEKTGYEIESLIKQRYSDRNVRISINGEIFTK